MFLAYYAKLWPGPLYCVIDDDDLKMWRLVRQYPQWCHVEHQNMPLADKWLRCMQLARVERDNFDAVMILGSDDFIDKEYQQHIETSLWVTNRGYVERFDDAEGALPELQIQPRYIHYYDAPTARLISRKHKRPGAGRVLSNAMLERLEWRPWTHGDRNIDGSMDKRLAQVYGGNVPTAYIEEPIGSILDVKTDLNMWDFEHLRTNNVTEKSPVEDIEAEPFLRERFPIIANELLGWKQ